MPSSNPERWVWRLRDAIRSDFPGPALEWPSIPRYDIIERIGEGAMAVVYRARDRQLDRPVALKILKTTFQDVAQVRQRVRREAQAVARLSHPNVIPVHDFGDEGGWTYLAMELGSGVTFERILSDGSATRPELLQVLIQVADGIQHAHDQGVIHRDLKPANILIGDRGQAMVGDFGLALLLESDELLTRSGAALGTPAYMAPEQVGGRREEIGPATDVYALGVMLYEALTGRRPHSAETSAGLYGKILGEEPMSPRRLRPDVPRDLDTIAMKAIEKAPGRRYPTARGFAEDLRRHLRGEPIHVRSVTTMERMARRVLRHWKVVAPVCLAVLIAVFAGAWAVVQEMRGAEAGRRRQDAERLLEEGRMAVDTAFKLRYLPDSDYESALSAVGAARRKVEEAIEKAPRWPQAHYLLGLAQELQGFGDRAEASWRRAIELDPDHALARYRLAHLQLQRVAELGIVLLDGEDAFLSRDRIDPIIREAEGHLVFARARGVGSEEEAVLGFCRAVVSFVNEDIDSVRAQAAEAIARYPRQQGIEELHWLLGRVSQGQDRLASYDRAIQRRPRYAVARSSRAYEKIVAGDHDGAIRDLREALLENPRMLKAHWILGLAFHQKGEPERAIDQMTRAIEIDPRFIAGYAGRALFRAERKDWKGAFEDYAKALEIDPACVDVIVKRGRARLEAGGIDAALEDGRRALELDPDSPDARALRGEILARRGDLAGAMKDLEDALRRAPAGWLRGPGIQELLEDIRRRIKASGH